MMERIDHVSELANPRNRQERTVMFVDMIGSTAMKESTTEVNWRAACAYLFDLVFDELHPLGRSVKLEARGKETEVEFPRVKYLGDGVMAVFADVRPEDVLNAAIRIQNRIDYLNRKKTVEFTCSIGVTHGSVVEWESAFGLDYIGPLVDKAARLCSEAPSEAIWIDDETNDACDRTKAAACSSPYETTPLSACIGVKRDLKLKGFRNPVGFRQVKWRLNGEDAAPAAEAKSSPMPEIGVGTVRRWDTNTGHGFVVDGNQVFYYSDRRFVADGADLELQGRVFFLLKEPLIAGKNQVAACVVSPGKRYKGRVSRITDKGYGFVQLIDGMGNLWSMFLYLGDNSAGIELGDEVTFEIGENDRGPCGKEPARLN